MPKPLGIQPMFDGLDAVVFKPKDGKDRPGLYLEECSYQAAKYAVEHWHYSGSMPAFPIWPYGVWLEGRYLGVVVFSRGASDSIGSPYGLTQDEVVELTRVALFVHAGVHVSRINRIAIQLLRLSQPALRLLVSYADPGHNHKGGIYQAGNWLYVGRTGTDYTYVDPFGNHWHSRMVSASGVKTVFGQQRAVVKSSDCRKIRLEGKYKYLYPLDAAMRAQIEPLRKPYPKCVGSAAVGTVSVQEISDGPNPIPTLHEQTRGGDLVSRR